MSAKKKPTPKDGAIQEDKSDSKDSVNLCSDKRDYKVTVIDIRKGIKTFMEKLNNLSQLIKYNLLNTINAIRIPKIQICAVREHAYTKVALKYGFVLGMTACIVLGIIKINPKLAFVVSINNRPVAVVNNKVEFDTSLNNLKQLWKNNYNLNISLISEPKFKIRLLPSRLISSKTQLVRSIEENTDLLDKAYAVSVDGQIKAILKDKQSADNILNSIKAKFQTGSTVGFFEDVQVIEAFVPTEYVQSFETAAAALTQNVESIKTYKVKKGDTLWDIADAANIPVEKLFELNSGLSENLKIGQIVKLSVPKAVINVKTIEYAEVSEQTPYETQFQNDQNKFKGDKKILVAGENGEKTIKVAIIKQNGVEVDKQVIEEKIKKDSKPEVVAIGTKEYRKADQKGTFRVPAFGSVTSRYGYRWGRMHEGVDISGNIGDSVAAADSGTVIFSGVESGYGNLVKIDHGNGFTTYYGHNKKNLVKVGQKVDKGEKIALLGNTGRSTGPHVHFEVRKNGRPQDPLKYIK